jgi:excisionase family DNA binding protein
LTDKITDKISDKLLTVAEVAEWLSMKPSWVREHARKRRRPYLPCVDLGRVMRFRKADIEEFIQECRTVIEPIRNQRKS